MRRPTPARPAPGLDSRRDPGSTPGRRARRTPRWVIALLASFALAACGGQGPLGREVAGSAARQGGTAESSASGSGSSSGSGASGAPDRTAENDAHLVSGDAVNTTWDVELARNATLLDYDVVDAALREADPTTGLWEFDTAALKGAKLTTGRALLVAGQGLGRISSVSERGGRTVVQTTEASLADVIDNGTVAWDAQLGFGEQWLVPEVTNGGQRIADLPGWGAGTDLRPRLAGIAMVDQQGREHDVQAQLRADKKISWTYSEGGNDYAFELDVQGDTVEARIEVTRNRLKYTFLGRIGAGTTSGTAEYAGGKLTSAQVGQSKLDGHIKMKVAAAGAGENIKFDYAVPGLMFKYFIPVGPVPLVVGMTAQIVGSIHVPASASSTFEATFTYVGNAQFRYTGREVKVEGQLGGFTMEAEPADPAGLIGEQVDVQFGVAFPRISVSLFESLLVPWIQPGLVIGNSLTWGPVCKTAYLRGELQAGYDFKILGVTMASDKATIWEKRRDAKGDSCK